MNLNDLLAGCDFNDCRERAMLADQLHQDGRLEEEALLLWAGREVGWDAGSEVLRCEVEDRPDPACPHCGFVPACWTPAWCEHVLAAGTTHYLFGAEHDYRAHADVHAISSRRRFEGPDEDTVPFTVFLEMQHLINLGLGSPVLPVRPDLPRPGDGRIPGTTAHQFHALIEEDATYSLRPIPESRRFRRGLDRVAFYYFCDPDPAGYLRRMDSLVRQRDAAGAPAFGRRPRARRKR